MWFTKTKSETMAEMQVDLKQGLSQSEAQKRLEQYGENKLKGKPPKSLIALFFGQMQDMLIYVLLVAAAITLFIGEYVDSIIIIGVVCLNAAIGVFQEYKAGKAIEALQKMSSPHAIVRRGGELVDIRSEEVVPGDIVILDAGRYIPADIRIIESANLQIEESALTGESVPSDKNADTLFDDPRTPLGDLSNMAFMSTLVTYGRGEGIAVGTAMNTEIGKIAKILDEDHKELTPLQKRLDELGRILGMICIGICTLIFAVSLWQGRDVFEMFLTAISLAVAAIPEGLAAIVAIVLSLGVTRMSKINAIVKKLPAVETLGSVNIICSDKTGTLTQNKMTVVQSYVAGKLNTISEAENQVALADEQELIRSFVLCSDATYERGEGTGDPTEIALIVLGNKFNMPRNMLNGRHERVGEKPFDSDRKLMSTLNKEEKGYRVHTKGALDNLLTIADKALVNGKEVPLTDALRQEYLTIAEQMAGEAYRVLGVGYKDTEAIVDPEEMEHGLTIIGLVGMIDPPRLEVKDSIMQAINAGIKPIMITGDHKNTAFAIAKDLGIADTIEQSMTGAEIDCLSDEEFAAQINHYRVFARVSPEHKVKIVRAFKAQGNVVSMTGDGVNDAPSLKFADIGVAMGITGTDVSKGAADMILADDNFSTIVRAIEEGRNIYKNIKKAVVFLLSCNLGEVVAIFFSILFFWPVPLLPTQILWVNLITDSLPAIALGIDTPDKDIMKEKPRDSNESFFAHGAGLRAVIGGVLIGIMTLVAFYIGISEYGYSLSSDNIPDGVITEGRTMAFVVLAVSQLFYSLSMRHESKSIFQIGIFTNKYLVMAISIGFLLQISVIQIPVLAAAFKVQPLTMGHWQTVIMLAVVPLIINEILKLLRRRA